jgi:hypothetical protein
MPRPSPRNEPIALCRHLLTSGAFGRMPEAPTGPNPEVTWCALTSRNRGPDGLFVHPSECHEARTCFEADEEEDDELERDDDSR